MKLKILQLVNSAFFGYCRHISSPAQAVELLGLETVKALVLSAKIFSQMDRSSMTVLAMDRIWAHRLATGVFAKTIATAEKCERAVADDAFMAGMLHDVGKLILAVNLPKQYKEALAGPRGNGASVLEAERQAFGVTHAEVGAYLLSLWGLPFPIVEAVAFHHVPGRCPQKKMGPLTAVHVGNCQEYAINGQEDDKCQIDAAYLNELKILPRIPPWQALCRQAIKEGDVHDD
ncbi:MAG: HDOD domain-containing protein [Thermodesulfobacteriota bacterium]